MSQSCHYLKHLWGLSVIQFLFSQVRAGSLQELVYKSGQAGVTKATVTITFDNRDKKQSPVGYESYDELTVSRQVSWHLLWHYLILMYIVGCKLVHVCHRNHE